jgi:hypothetical protein
LARRRGDPSLIYSSSLDILCLDLVKKIYLRNQIFFGQKLVTYDNFGDGNDKVAVIGIDFVGRRSIYGYYL